MENIGRRGRLMYVGIGLVFAILLSLYFLYQAKQIVLVILLTLLLSILVSAPVNYLTRRGLSRGWGTLIVVGVLTLVLVLATLVLVPVVAEQIQQLAETLPSIISDAQSLVDSLRSTLGLGSGDSLDSQQLLDSARSSLSSDMLTTILGVGASVANILSLLFVVLISTIFVVVQPEPLVNGFVAFFPAGRRQRVREILHDMYDAVQKWFLGQLASMTIVGVLFTIALFIIGVPFALLFGILAGLLAFVPFLGPAISVIPPTLVAFFQEPISALWVILTYLVLQSIEGNIIQPLIMSRAVSLHPAVIIFALLVMGTLFHAIGILLAVPLTAAIQVLVRELWIKRMNEQGTDPNPPAEEESSTEKGMGRLWRAAKGLFRRS